MSTSTTTAKASVAFGVAVCAALLWTGAGRTPKAVAPVAVDVAGAASWPMPHFIQADRQGRVSLLRASTYEVLPLRLNGSPGDLEKLERLGLSQGTALRAAMSPGGDWLVLAPPRVRLFRDGKEQAVGRLEWEPFGVGFVGDDPLLSVQPNRIVPDAIKARTADPPLVLRWTGNEWETFLTEPLPPGTKRSSDIQVMERRSVHLMGDSKSTVWVANEFVYRIRRFSRSGRLLLEWTYGDQELRSRPNADRLQGAFAAKAAKEHASANARVEGQAVTAARAIAGMAEGRDGKIYALVTQGTPSGDYVLDRYDAVTSQVERMPLQLKNLGFVSLAAGRDALYIAGFNPKSGRFKISWERLEQASWTVLEGARLSSSGTPPEEPPAGK